MLVRSLRERTSIRDHHPPIVCKIAAVSVSVCVRWRSNRANAGS
jgi:hypothetical protein